MTKVAVLGAAGGIGQPLSLLLKLNEVGRVLCGFLWQAITSVLLLLL
jgi:hypothetical protein